MRSFAAMLRSGGQRRGQLAMRRQTIANGSGRLMRATAAIAVILARTATAATTTAATTTATLPRAREGAASRTAAAVAVSRRAATATRAAIARAPAPTREAAAADTATRILARTTRAQTRTGTGDVAGPPRRAHRRGAPEGVARLGGRRHRHLMSASTALSPATALGPRAASKRQRRSASTSAVALGEGGEVAGGLKRMAARQGLAMP